MIDFAGTLLRLLPMPPLNMLVLLAIGWLLRRRWPRTGKSVIALSLLCLYVLSTNGGASLLVRPLEALTAPVDLHRPHGAGAIVVLGASSIEAAPEYGGLDVPDPVALVRLQYTAHLQHATGLPILASGGPSRGRDASHAVAATMARVLRDDFRTEVLWTEEKSTDTEQNAANSAAILKAAGVRRILLVTHAMHMPRAREAFMRHGIEVVEAPTLFYSRARSTFWSWLPSASGLYRSYYATHEWIGFAWYRWRAHSS